MLTNWKRIIRIIRLIKGGCFKILQLSKGNDAWKSGAVDPCAHVQIQYIECLVLPTTRNDLIIQSKWEEITEWRNRWHKPKSWIMGENKKAIYVLLGCFSLFHFLYFLYIHPLLFVQVWNAQKTRADWHLFCRVHSGGAGVVYQAHPKLSRLTNSLSSTPAEISLPMSLQMDHILNECVLACVCVLLW